MMMKMFAVLAVALLLSAPVLADDTPAGIASDVGAVQKDNQAIAKHNANLAEDRAEKAKDKANGNWANQAGDSVRIGADKTMRSEKETEKSVDKRILRHDVNEATGDNK